MEPSVFCVLEVIDTMVPTEISAELLALPPVRNSVLSVVWTVIDLFPMPRIVKPSALFLVTVPNGLAIGRGVSCCPRMFSGAPV